MICIPDNIRYYSDNWFLNADVRFDYIAYTY